MKIKNLNGFNQRIRHTVESGIPDILVLIQAQQELENKLGLCAKATSRILVYLLSTYSSPNT
jgi:hypothetical protein